MTGADFALFCQSRVTLMAVTPLGLRSSKNWDSEFWSLEIFEKILKIKKWVFWFPNFGYSILKFHKRNCFSMHRKTKVSFKEWAVKSPEYVKEFKCIKLIIMLYFLSIYNLLHHLLRASECLNTHSRKQIKLSKVPDPVHNS